VLAETGILFSQMELLGPRALPYPTHHLLNSSGMGSREPAVCRSAVLLVTGTVTQRPAEGWRFCACFGISEVRASALGLAFYGLHGLDSSLAGTLTATAL